MAANISQKEYLKKYLTGGKSSDVKKKKKKRAKGAGLQIIDDDVDVSKLRPLDSAEIDILLDGNEDAPQIAGIVDDRPEDVKKMEQFRLNSKWRVLTEDDGFNSKVKIEEVKGKKIRVEGQIYAGSSATRNISQKTDFKTSSSNKQNERDTRLESDESPPRKVGTPEVKKSSKNRRHSISSNDQSPPRKKFEKNKHKPSQKSDSDVSPPPKSTHRKSAKSDSDISPPRKSTHRRAEKQDSDISPPRQSRKSKSEKSDSDTSPPRKPRRRSQQSDSDQSPVRKRRPDSDTSPPRKTTKRTERKSRWGYFEDPDKKTSVTDDTKGNPNDVKRHRSRSSDASPPRRRRNDHSPDRSAFKNQRRHDSKDLSPPRKRSYDSTEKYRRDQGHPQSSSSRQDRTLEGKKAEFREAKQFLQEDAEFKRKERDMLHNMADNVSGRNAQTVARKTGRKRQPSIDKEQQERDLVKQKEREEKYTRWGRGLKQTEEREGRVQDYLHESNKPMARYRDDEDLEVMLKKQEREGDPMANYMREKKGESGAVIEAKPIYKGSYPPNRFQIRPGYRWDGVDRSNGYENKYFESKNTKIALEKDAYKWSTEDM